MKRLNLKSPALTLIVGGLLALTTLMVLGEPSMANTRSDQQHDDVRQGLPGRRISGGSRSPNTACLATPNQPVVALMPKSNLGLTLSERPTFWFALPAISPDRMLEFGLYDEAGGLIYQERFNASGKAGISSLSLPDTFSPLSAEQDYRWYLSVVCNPESRSEDLVVTGWIRRMQADSELRTKLANTTLQERLSVYETSELWFDTLTTIAELRRRAQADTQIDNAQVDNAQIDNAQIDNDLMLQLAGDPSLDAQQIDEQWQDLLASIDLTQVATVPFSDEPMRSPMRP
ncbi:MAG: DUF928 domain-containing protein [Cyanobacteria bacterium P01_D01_bin.105]